MNKNIEIEFKTAITKEKYEELLALFNLENNIFKQVNYYFDTDTFDLNKQKTVLRIRQKRENFYKVTLKSQSEHGAFESHVLLNEDQAKDMIEHGFYTKDFFDDVDYFVTFKAELQNERVSTPHTHGTLFFDRCEYYGITDYEVEYEVEDYEEGLIVFKQFLAEHHIPFVLAKRKSERALDSRK
ncbi:MAG: CYTH domain-containing protein [Acholeplasmataceae bacterium]